MKIRQPFSIRRLTQFGLTGLSTFLIILFSSAALLRRLNFDESLLVRSGWLSYNNVDYAPAFFMPVTLLAGILSTCISDPGILFTIIRSITVLSVITVFLFCILKSTPTSVSTAIGFTLLLTNSAFIVHGLEFRYDWAILLGLLLSFCFLQNEHPTFAFLSGTMIVFISLHHTKGLYYAFCIYGIALFSYIRIPSSSTRQKVWALHAGIGLSCVFWLSFCLITHKVHESIELYRTFTAVGSDMPRNTFNKYFMKGLTRDSMWWLSIFCLTTALTKNIKQFLQDHFLTTATLYLFSTLLFPFIHPHPWPYMFAIAVPFASLIIVRLWNTKQSMHSKLHLLFIGTIVLGTHTLVGSDCVYKTYSRSLVSTIKNQVRAMRALKSYSKKSDTVLDPSGLAYFLNPCNKEWYTDQLFRVKMEKGTWMNDLQHSLDSCTWVVSTYRLSYLDDKVSNLIDTLFIPKGAILRINHRFAKDAPIDFSSSATFNRLKTFW